MEYLSIGKIIDSFGLDGSAKIFSSTSNPKIRYKKGSKVFLSQNGTDLKELTVDHYRESGRFVIAKFNEINVKEEMEQFKGFELLVEKNYSDLKVGYYFYSDLIGCSIVDDNKNKLGIVSKVEEFPAQLTLRVKRNNKPDFFVPFIKQFIINVDIVKKEITINVLEGMLWKLQY